MLGPAVAAATLNVVAVDRRRNADTRVEHTREVERGEREHDEQNAQRKVFTAIWRSPDVAVFFLYRCMDT